MKRNQRRLLYGVKLRDGKTTSVGWLVHQQNDIICYACHRKDHINPLCNLKLRQLNQVIANYEALSVDDKARVPAITSNNTKAYLNFVTSLRRETTGGQNLDTKN